MSVNNKQLWYDQYHMRDAINISNMSHATRLKVGTVIVRDHRPVVNGCNGTLPGEDNNTDIDVVVCDECVLPVTLTKDYCDGDACCECDRYISGGPGTHIITCTKSSVLHAEENAILYAARKGIPLEGATVYSTVAPCMRCSRMIVACKIREVCYMDHHTDMSGVELLKRRGITVRRIHMSNERGDI